MPLLPGLLVLFALLSSPATDPAAAAVRRVSLTCANAPACAVDGALVVDGMELPVRGGVADIPAAATSVELRAEGYWMPPQAPANELRVWRTAAVRGRFRSTDELPATFKVRFSSPPMAAEPRVPSDSEIECPIAPDGAWSCALPATTLDVALRAKGFTPRYVWDLKVPSAFHDPIALTRGASFVAWIDRRVAATLKKPATARFLRAAMADPSVLGQRLNEPVAEAAFNRRGMVQLAPIPPGMYTLEIVADGFATTRMENIEIYERSESTLRRVIELQPPLTIRLTLQPPVDGNGAPWIVDLHHFEPIARRPTRVQGGAFREPGVYEAKGQAAGQYSVTVRDARGNRYASSDLVITGEADAQRTIELALSAIGGTVLLGDEPIAAELRFGGNGGAEQIKTTAGAEGRFEVTLPRSGRWKIDVESAAHEIDTVVELTIEKDQRDLTIELPDTEVAGWVVDAEGARLPRAQVIVQSSAGVVMKDAAADGSFRLRGIAPGAAKIHATHPATKEYSRIREVTVTGAQPVVNLELAIEAASDLAGVVLSNGQPVAGARVAGYGDLARGARQERTVTALDGSFRLAFPDDAREILLLVAAAGRTLQAFPIAGRPRSKTTLELAPAGGTLRLEWGEKAQPAIYANGALLPLNDLFLWARSHGQNIVDRAVNIPHLAPGSYRFCNGARCADGILAARGTLTLSVTSAEPSKSP